MIVELQTLCDIVRGSSPRPQGDPKYYGGPIPRLMVSDVTRDGMYVTPKIDSLTIEGATKSRPMKQGDVVIAVSGDAGEPCILNVDACIHDGFVGLRNLDEKKIFKPYLYQYLKSVKISNASLAVGAIYKNLNTDQIKSIKIPLPPLPEQKRIADLLDAADSLRQKDKTLLKKYDQLTQSLFLEMFGDPVKNEKGWEVKTMNELCSKITDGTHDTPIRLKEGIKFITGKHIRPFIVDYDNSDFVTEEIHSEIYKRCNPEYGDILYTNIGVNYATAAMNTVDYEFSMKNVALLKYNRTHLNGRYLESILNNEFFKDRLKSTFGIGGAQQFLSLSNIKSINLLCPPLTLQNKFAEKVQLIEKQKELAKKNLEKSEELFGALMGEVFKK
jgi:type I restriction enzyme S subunit